MQDKTVLELANRLNEIRKIKNELDIEYNMIIKELWERIPSLKDDVNMQLTKTKNKGKN